MCLKQQSSSMTVRRCVCRCPIFQVLWIQGWRRSSSNRSIIQTRKPGKAKGCATKVNSRKELILKEKQTSINGKSMRHTSRRHALRANQGADTRRSIRMQCSSLFVWARTRNEQKCSFLGRRGNFILTEQVIDSISSACPRTPMTQKRICMSTQTAKPQTGSFTTRYPYRRRTLPSLPLPPFCALRCWQTGSDWWC